MSNQTLRPADILSEAAESVQSSPTPAGRRRSLSERFKRSLRYRLVIPLKRSRHPPEYTARGVAVGLFWAMTPTVGVQMAVVGLHWFISRRFLKLDFNIVAAMAWTWVTNVFTVVPFYYLFYVSGQIMLGRDDVTGYQGFLRLWEKAMAAGAEGAGSIPFSQLVQTWAAILFEDWFAAMFVGSVPWAALSGWIGWRWALKAVRAYRRARNRHTAENILNPAPSAAAGGGKKDG